MIDSLGKGELVGKNVQIFKDILLRLKIFGILLVRKFSKKYIYENFDYMFISLS